MRNRITRPALLCVIVAAATARAQQEPPKLPPIQVPKVVAGGAVTPTPTPSAEQLRQQETHFAETMGMSYEEWAREYYKVFKLPKKHAIVISENRVKPAKIMNDVYELVGEEGDFYLARNLPPWDPQSPDRADWAKSELDGVIAQMRGEYLADKYFVTDQDDIVPPFTDRIAFTNRSEGLPRSGKWQMSLDVADMNGDGRLDIVAPPIRTGPPYPWIFLQGSEGRWAPAREARWPSESLKTAYGAVRVADFDGDGNKDVALASHFALRYVFYGDGKGGFTRYVTLPSPNQAVTSRSLVVADFNNDGRPDLATLAEVDVEMSSSKPIRSGLVNVLLNLPEGWRAVTAKFPATISGDWLTAGDIDGDGWVDLILTSRKAGVRELIWRNASRGYEWESIADLSMPHNGFVFTANVGHFDSFPAADVVMCFEQFNPKGGEPPSQACVLYRFHDDKGRFTRTPQATLLLKSEEDFNNIKASAIGDLDGDGRDDLVIATARGAIRVFLQLSPGSLFEDTSPELAEAVKGTDVFDLKIVDLDGDHFGELLVMGAPKEEGKGGIWVFSPHKTFAGEGKKTP